MMFINVKNNKDRVDFDFRAGELSWEKDTRTGSLKTYRSEAGDEIEIYWDRDGPVMYWNKIVSGPGCDCDMSKEVQA